MGKIKLMRFDDWEFAKKWLDMMGDRVSSVSITGVLDVDGHGVTSDVIYVACILEPLPPEEPQNDNILVSFGGYMPAFQDMDRRQYFRNLK